MADQKDRQNQEAYDLMHAIEQITAQKGHLQREADAIREAEQATRAQVANLEAELGSIAQEMHRKRDELQRIKDAMFQKESEYMAILEAAPSLVQVLKR